MAEIGAELLVSDDNVGFGTAVNRAVAASTADVVILVNPDAVVEPETVESLVAHLDANPGVAAASPTILNQEGRVWFAGGHINPWLARPELPHFGRTPPPPVVGPSPFVTGSVVAVRRAAFDEKSGRLVTR